jgi:hypothetical protein
MPVSFYVYVVRDPHDAVWADLAKTAETMMMIDGLRYADRSPVEVKMPSYMIPVWCRDHGFRCLVTVRTVEM